MPSRISGRATAAIVALGGSAAIVAGAVAVTGPWAEDAACRPAAAAEGQSVARRWNEVMLDGIRRDLPAPTVHARNLFHVSAAMWDAWAAYDQSARGMFVVEKPPAGDVAAAREEAISYAAYRVLEARYIDAVGGSDTVPQFDALMADLCYPVTVTTTAGDSPAALGNRIAQAMLEAGLRDGSNEAEGYSDPDYEPVNEALVVSEPGTTMTDPNRWQPLQLEDMVSQNGIAIRDGVQEFIDPHWGSVAGFALPRPVTDGLPMDPGAPPRLGSGQDDAFKGEAVAVIRYSSLLDPATRIPLDISPGALGGNPLGTNDGAGHPVNPITGTPYAPHTVDHGDFGRALAEFWADGPRSETPPGHWNTIANAVSDELGDALRIGGREPAVDRLEWDVKLYLTLNGASHDAAVVAWGAKKHYDTARPISVIRYMGGLGQSSAPSGPSYHPDGLPLEPGLIEVITRQSTAAGQRHAALRGNEGDIAILAWTGNPEDPDAETAGVGWIRAVDWVPYMRPTFVTPAFAGYVSGHSTFSRAAAEVLASFTGSQYFPGGLSEWTIEADSYGVEAGPEQDVTLQWATYFDAADQAGLARLYAGIHIPADDLAGRRLGAACGLAAWQRAQQYFGGTPAG